jgi:hypothetical protein
MLGTSQQFHSMLLNNTVHVPLIWYESLAVKRLAVDGNLHPTKLCKWCTLFGDEYCFTRIITSFAKFFKRVVMYAAALRHWRHWQYTVVRVSWPNSIMLSLIAHLQCCRTRLKSRHCSSAVLQDTP